MNLGVLFVFGIAVLGGTTGGWLFRAIRVPQVVGYIAIGLALGGAGLGVISPSDVKGLEGFNLFALGLIGLMVGGELKLGELKKYGKQFAAILLVEGIGAFLLVTVATFLILNAVINDWKMALAASLVFGAIASATDPASTMNVIWEYRGAGKVTTAIIAIIALDDALAMTLYGFSSGAMTLLTGNGDSTIAKELLIIAGHLFGSLALGVGIGYMLRGFLVRSKSFEHSVSVIIGTVLLSIFVASYTHLDVILITMATGFTLVNTAPKSSVKLFELVRGFSDPIYIIFFVLVGARLAIGEMPGWLWAIAAVYVVGRGLGKYAGSFYGGKLSGADANVQKYAGVGLFAQGGVAVGLAIIAGKHLENVLLVKETGLMLGDAVVFVITATTLAAQFIGPACVKLALKKSGEMNRNVTEEDIISEMKVADVIDDDFKPLPVDYPFRSIIRDFTHHHYMAYPVVDSAGELTGVMTLEGLKPFLANESIWDWTVAADVMSPPRERVTPDMPLADALAMMRRKSMEQIPIIASDGSRKPVGMLDIRTAMNRVRTELLKRTQTEAARQSGAFEAAG